MSKCDHKFRPFVPTDIAPNHSHYTDAKMTMDVLATYCERCGEIRRETKATITTPTPKDSKEEGKE